MKNLYNKIAPVISKIALAGLILALLGLVGARLYTTGLQPDQLYELYYAQLVMFFAPYVAIAFAVVYVVFSVRTLLPALKERLRKLIVSVKRNPSIIPLLMLFVTFLYFSLNLTDVSNTTARVQGKNMGLSAFCIMLLSLLSLVCMLNAFPRRKKANVPMLVLMFVMCGIIIYCDIHYSNMILAAMNRLENPIVIEESTIYIAKAFNMLNVHKILVIVSLALVATLPFYSKLLRKINTSITIEENQNMAKIDIQD